jgi:hypothetical protein
MGTTMITLCYECKHEWENCAGCTIVWGADIDPNMTIEEGADSVVKCDGFEQK